MKKESFAKGVTTIQYTDLEVKVLGLVPKQIVVLFVQVVKQESFAKFVATRPTRFNANLLINIAIYWNRY